MSQLLADHFQKLATVPWRELNPSATLRSAFGRGLFPDHDYVEEYGNVAAIRKRLRMPNRTGGVGGRAGLFLYQATRWMRPAKVLEVGTRAGISALTFALAMQKNDLGQLWTVDVLDVNNGQLRAPPGEPLSPVTPEEMMRHAAVDHRVTFVLGKGSEFMKSCAMANRLDNATMKFDIIFLDGSHSAQDVYAELQLCFDVLAPNGIIILDDVYPNFKLMAGRTNLTRGPWMALQRHLFEGAPFEITPVGAQLGDPPAMAYLTRKSA